MNSRILKSSHIFRNNRIFLVLLLVLVLSPERVSAKKYKPADVPVATFDSTGFIVDPDHTIEEEWLTEAYGSRKIYFFSRFVEPVCVVLRDISDPTDIDAFADKLIRLWQLEDKSEGRFVFQLEVLNQKKIVYRFGSKMEEFYSAHFTDSLKARIEEIHYGNPTGTGTFVSISTLGSNIFDAIAYDSDLSNYDGGTHIHKTYPEKVIRTNGTMQSLVSPSHDNSHLRDAQQKLTYFQPLEPEKAEKYYKRIVTNGICSTVAEIKNNRVLNGSRVSDQHNILPVWAEEQINGILLFLEDDTDFEVAVVCLNSIGDKDPHDFGTELLNYWGVGDSDSDNGLVILLVHDVHAIEFITGRGTEQYLTDGQAYDIQQEHMVPYFKKNDYVTGMIRGVQAVDEVLHGVYYYPSEDEYDNGSGTDGSFDWKYGFGIYISVASGVLFLWILVILLAFFIPNLHRRYHVVKLFTLKIFPILLPLPFWPLFYITKGLMDRWRKTVRFSPKTGEVMQKLSEESDNEHLSKGQISEEFVKSIDYDVWVNSEGTDVLILSYQKWFSKYNKCPSCKFRTYFLAYDRTIVSATYTSSGRGEKKYNCTNCGHSKTTSYTIPRLTKSSSSSSSSGSSSGRSSGGSSWGGGSSRGGGAGSRW